MSTKMIAERKDVPDEDKSNQFYLGLHQRALNIHTRASEMASFRRHPGA